MSPQKETSRKELVKHRDEIEARSTERANELKENEEYLREIWNNLDAGIMVVDAETREIIDVNRAAAELIQAPREAILGKECHSFLCSAERESCPILNLEQAIDRSERTLLRADGTPVPIVKTVRPFRLRGRDVFIESFLDISRLKESEQQLSRCKHIVSCSTDMLALLDRDFVYLAVNPVYAKAFGMATEDLVGKSMSEVFGEVFFNVAIERGIERCLDGEEVHYQDWFDFPAYGRQYVDIVYSPHLADDGSIAGFVVSARAITAQHESQTELQEALDRQALQSRILATVNRPNAWQALLADLLKEIKEFTQFDAVGIRLPEGEDFPYNEASGFSSDFVARERSLCARDQAGDIIRDAFGQARLECLCGSVIRGLVDPSLPFFTENGSFWTNSTTKLLAETPAEDLEVCTRKRCNTEGYESVALIPLRVGDDVVGLLQLNDRRTGRFTLDMIHFFEELGHSIGIAFNKQRASDSLSRSERRYRTMFESSRDAIMTLAPPIWNYVDANPTALDLFKIQDKHSLGTLHPWILSPEVQPDGRSSEEKALDMIERALASGTHFFEWTHSDLEGNDFPTTVHLTQFELDGQAVLQATVRDITQAAKLEEQFRQAQKMEAVGRLAGGVAHDFNNMIGGILGYCELLLSDLNEADPARSDVKHIQDCAQRSAALTRQLLAFSRKQVLAPEVLDLNVLIDGFTGMLHRLLGEDVELCFVPCPGTAGIKADPGQIEQVIMNLAINARDAMPDGGRLVMETAQVELDEDFVVMHPGANPGPHIMLAITDTGSGMDKSTMAKIFEPFFTTKGLDKGTGLGLATVYGIVEQSGGVIHVYSEPGQGTTFKVYLPQVDEAPEAHRPAQSADVHGKGETILAVEDEDGLRELLVRILKRSGYKVISASNGGAALLLCESHKGPIDLLITDVVMPEMGGPQLADRLMQTRKDMKVLYMSGYTDDAILNKGVLGACANFIHKPFNRNALLAKIRVVLNREQSKAH